MNILVCLLGLVVAVQSLSESDLMLKEWNKFKATYGKNYSAVEDHLRMKIFWQNSIEIKRHNELYDQGKETFFKGMNEHGDWFPEEIKSRLLGNTKKISSKGASTYLSPANYNFPSSIDWRNYGYVTPIKNQGSCGACWAFSTVCSLEGQYFKKTGRLVSLSEQNLVDCTLGQNYGCQGGWMEYAFEYIRNNGGIDTEESYPYEEQNGYCRFRTDTIGATVSGYVKVPPNDEMKLAEAVSQVGPISVYIDANQDFQYYSGGVFYSSSCSSTTYNHAVTVVGYGTDPYYGDYWTIKNSWGTQWGESGFGRVARNRNNHCAIATDPVYPLV